MSIVNEAIHDGHSRNSFAGHSRPAKIFFPVFVDNRELVIYVTKKLGTVVVFYILCTLIFTYGLEGWSVLDCVYFLTATISTVGYGDYAATTDRARVFTIFIILVGLVYIFSIINEFAIYVLELAQKKSNEIARKNPGDELEMDEHKYTKQYCASIGTVFLVVFLGSIFFWRNEEKWSYVGALYWCVCTTTTVGYGDMVMEHDSSRLFLIFYIPISVCVVAASLGKYSAIEMEKAAEERRLVHLTRKLDFNLIRSMDTDGDGVDKLEFLIAMLVQNEICDKERDIDPWLKRFEELDVDNSGKLDEMDIRLMEEQETERISIIKGKMGIMQDDDHHTTNRTSTIKTTVLHIQQNPIRDQGMTENGSSLL